MNKTRTIIADDHSVVLTGLSMILTASGKYEVVGTAADGNELIQLSQTVRADVILVDYRMPLLNGVDTLMKLKEKCKAKIVFVTSYTDEWLVAKAKEIGATGVISKTADEELLLSLLDKIVQGEKVFPTNEEIYNRLYAPLKTKYKLTESETSTIKDIQNGKGIKEIAERNNISTETVKTHKKNAFEKLGIKKITMLNQFLNRF